MSALPACDAALVSALRAALLAAAVPAKAPAMQAYMKSAMPFYGVSAVPRERALRAVLAAHPPLRSFAAWRDTALTLWRGAHAREERYAVFALLAHAPHQAHSASLEALPLYEELIVTGAWWDYVDTVAPRHLGALLAAHGAAFAPTLRAWARCDDVWKRRSAIIAQLGAGQAADAALLYDCVGANLRGSAHADSFWVQKALGWALRQRARVAPAEVQTFVRKQGDALSALTRREALKHVGAGDAAAGKAQAPAAGAAPRGKRPRAKAEASEPDEA
jgi:3-methyladenine DNA glycosylase AlkD